jgi:hypothetical protein
LTKRLHFFDAEFDEDSLERIFSGSDSPGVGQLRQAYVGFVVARPLPTAIVGRTVLRTYEPVGVGGAERSYPTRRKYSPYLFGIRLDLDSLAYQQQDKAVAACATVALWSAFHKTQRLFDSARPTPAAITRSANLVRGSARSMPSRALTSEQIAEAIRVVGLEPELIEINADTPLSSLIYSYVRFGVPIVLLVYLFERGGHAMTVAGYALSDKPLAVAEKLGSIPYLGRRIERFFVHDDNVGPFAHLKIVRPPSDPLQEGDSDAAYYLRKAPYALEIDRKDELGKREKLLCVPHLAIVPVYAKIRLPFVALHGWLDSYASVLEEYGSKLGLDPKELTWDVRLDSSNAFKAELRADDAAHCFGYILTKPYPRYIWRASISMGHRRIVELIADTTEMADAFPFLDALYYDEDAGREIRRFFSLPEVGEDWSRIIGARFVEFLRSRT